MASPDRTPLHLTGHARLDALGWPQPMAIETLEDFMAWGEAWQATLRVAEHTVGTLWLSTVFTGFLPEKQQPFETMLTPDDDPRRREFWRYSTYADAWAGHHALLAQLRWP